jgi:hypothetical protein
VKSRYIRLAENGNLPRNNAPRLSTLASPRMTSTARGACRASSDSASTQALCGAPLVLVAGHLGAFGAGERMMGLARACGGATGPSRAGSSRFDGRNGVSRE